MVSAHLATINCILLPHALLDESMTSLALNGPPAHGFANFPGIPDQTRIMDDGRTRLFGQETLRQQSDNVIPLNKITGFIKKEAAIKITIPGNAKIGIVFMNGVDGWLAVFFQQRIGYTVGKITVGLMMHTGHIKWQVRQQLICNNACTAVTRINNQFQRL